MITSGAYEFLDEPVIQAVGARDGGSYSLVERSDEQAPVANCCGGHTARWQCTAGGKAIQVLIVNGAPKPIQQDGGSFLVVPHQ